MTFWSVADCCWHLGIDPKTLHRWLAQAQLPLQRHPTDGRKHGLSEHHLRHLACLHHRSLAPLPAAEPPGPAPGTCAPGPWALLDLPEQLATLQAQLSAVQQQLAELAHLLQPQAQPPALAAGSARTRTPARPSSPPRSRSAAPAKLTPPRKPTHVIPLVEANQQEQYVVMCPRQGRLAFVPDSPEWFTWLASQSSFRFVGSLGRFTAHHEVLRVPNGAWRAHRQMRNHTYNLRLGPTQELTIAVLEQAAATLQAHLR
jgi:transposase-like protein